MKYIIQHKGTRLFMILGGIFLTNALIAEFIGVKIFSLERVLGLEPINLTLFGVDNLSFNLTAGVLLWPVVFVLTDVINEYFGPKGVRMLSHMAVVLIAYAFVMFYFGINLEPADFWPQSHIQPQWDDAKKAEVLNKVGDYDYAFQLVFGQGLWIIFGSLVAFLIGQIVDVAVFHRIKASTGEKMVWLRATGSTLISQFIDSFIVLLIAFYFGANWPLVLVLAIGLVNYMYKFVVAIILTPVIYAAHWIIDWYLGEEMSKKMKLQAQRSE